MTARLLPAQRRRMLTIVADEAHGQRARARRNAALGIRRAVGRWGGAGPDGTVGSEARACRLLPMPHHEWHACSCCWRCCRCYQPWAARCLAPLTLWQARRRSWACLRVHVAGKSGARLLTQQTAVQSLALPESLGAQYTAAVDPVRPRRTGRHGLDRACRRRQCSSRRTRTFAPPTQLTGVVARSRAGQDDWVEQHRVDRHQEEDEAGAHLTGDRAAALLDAELQRMGGGQ